MVRDQKLPDELECTDGVVTTQLRPCAHRTTPSSGKPEVGRRSLVLGNLNDKSPGVTRDVAARANADFEKIFGS